MNRNSRRLFTSSVLLGGLGFACLLTVATLAFIGLSTSSRGTTPGFAPADLTVIPAPTSTVPASPTATLDPLAGTATLPANAIAVGAYVQISGTDGQGLRLRSAPGLASDLLFLGEDSEVFQVKDGPKDSDGYTWWYIVAPYDNTRAGWAASNFLSVVPPPQSQ